MREFLSFAVFFIILAASACTPQQDVSRLTPSFEGAIPIDGFIKF